jgi:hypothetical protein
MSPCLSLADLAHGSGSNPEFSSKLYGTAIARKIIARQNHANLIVGKFSFGTFHALRSDLFTTENMSCMSAILLRGHPFQIFCAVVMFIPIHMVDLFSRITWSNKGKRYKSMDAELTLSGMVEKNNAKVANWSLPTAQQLPASCIANLSSIANLVQRVVLNLFPLHGYILPCFYVVSQ